uniref:US22 family protein n=1 Tax=Nothobranchius kuhntae TaxID=321403 RepID=A0A1A8KLB4_NOTKU
MESCHPFKSFTDFPRCNGLRGTKYLDQVSRFVSERRSTTFILTNPAGATLTLGPMKDTEYKDKPEEVNGCSKFYLPTKLQFQVIGYVEGVSFTCEQLILMINENGEFYGYDGDQMHLVASSIEELIQNGLDYPSSKSYYYGEAFKDMTQEDWEKVRSSPLGQRLDKEHRELVASQKSRVSEIMRIKRQRLAQQRGSGLPSRINQLQTAT